jgi:outer membrane protein TolC
MRMWGIMLAIMVVTGRGAGGQAPTLTLAEALSRAEQGAYANRIADAQARAAEGQASLALKGVLPGVRLEGGYLRTTDPLGAFGSTLRQRTVTPSAFEPARLNHPLAIGNLTSALILEQPIFNADALLGRRAASRAGEAARATATWTATGTAVDVVRAYYGAVLAAEHVSTLDSAARAAHAHQRIADSHHRNGLATRSDALLAAVRAGEIDVQLIEARGAARLARSRLATVLGATGEPGFGLPGRLPEAAAIVRLADVSGPAAPAERADVRAAELSLAAASADARRASALLLPRVNAFGRLDWSSADRPFGGENAWTAGVMVSWSLFGGGSELAERRMAQARRGAAEAAVEAAAAQGRLEQEAAANALEVARARMAITERAVGQSSEAHRIVIRKYEGGLATAVELFDAAAAETGARLGFAEARYQAIVAIAMGHRAAGRSLDALTRLDSLEP